MFLSGSLVLFFFVLFSFSGGLDGVLVGFADLVFTNFYRVFSLFLTETCWG